MQYHSGDDSVALGIAPASPASWDLGPRLHIRFGVGGTLNSKSQVHAMSPEPGEHGGFWLTLHASTASVW